MIFDWYKIINQAEFIATGLVSRELELPLEDLGVKTILVTRGRLVSLVYEGIMLAAQLNDENPFVFEGHAVYLDANQDLWLGIEVDES